MVNSYYYINISFYHFNLFALINYILELTLVYILKWFWKRDLITAKTFVFIMNCTFWPASIVHEWSHYLVAKLIAPFTKTIEVKLPEYYPYVIKDNCTIGTNGPSKVNVSFYVKDNETYYTSQLLLFPFVYMSPLLIVIPMFIFLPISWNVIIHILTMGRLFPSNGDFKNLYHLIRYGK